MAEAVLFDIVGRILWNLGSVAIQEIGSLWGVKDELRKLEKSMSAIKAVVLDAEEKRISNHQVKDWLQKLEEVVYEADNLVDEFHTEALRRIMTPGNNQMAKKVRVFFSSSNQLAFRVKMGNKIKGIREMLDEIRANKSFYLMENMEEKAVFCSGRETHSFAREEEVIGRDEDKVKMLNLLLDLGFGEGVSFISIVGMGGLGKTTLAQLVFNDEKVQKHFELKIWVCVSDVFDLKLIIEKIIKSATKTSPNNLEMDQLQNQLREELEGKRYLIVLDDMWNENHEKWLSLKSLLMGGAGGSRVLVTTRSERVVKITRSQPYYLMGLGKDKSWSLFKRMAFEKGQEPEDPSIAEMGMEIVEKCGGVPLAIRTIGSTLYLKNPKTEWLSFKNNELAKTNELESDVLQALELSYKHLPSHLKHCFGYCALFPKDYHIDVQMLIKLWMAQGFIKSTHQNQCVEDVGYGYFLDLLWRSFFQEAKKDDWGAIRSCKMHDLMHDLAIRVAGTSSRLLNESMENFSESTRHVSYDFEFNKPLRIPASLIEKSKIRTFLLPKQRYEERLNVPNFDELWSNFKFLRMLDLKCLHIEILPNSLGKLKHLRYLNLSHNKIEMLPNSITRLQNLQTLILFGCKKLLSLPVDMNKLISLRHLEIYECWSLTHMPCGLGELTALQTLDQFIVVENDFVLKDSGRLGELSHLNNLRGELAIKNLGHGKHSAVESKDANLKEKQHLNSLRLVWKNEDCDYTNDTLESDEISLDRLQPHSNLKSLKVEYFLGVRIASWLSLLTNLVKLYLIGCKNCQHLPPLDQIPSLKELKLLSLTSLHYVSDVDGGISTGGVLFPSSPSLATPFFPSLLKLEIRDCPNLCGWWRDIDDSDEDFESMMEYQNIPSFPCLSYLTIESCPDLTFLPLFPHLESLSLTNTSSKPLVRTMMMMNDSTEAAATSTLTPSSSISASVSSSLPSSSSFSSCFSPLSKLKYLFMSNIEDIEHLPQEIGNLSSLELIHLWKCPNLASLPDGIRRLSSVWIFQVGECPKLTSWLSSHQRGLA